jgi:hypothetical protein
VYETGTAIWAGAWLGAVFAACGSGIVGIPAAYYVNRSLRHRGSPSAAGTIPPLNTELPQVQHACLRRTLIGLYAILLVPPPIWLAYHAVVQEEETRIIDALRSATMIDAHYTVVGPRWGSSLEAGFGVVLFRRVHSLTVTLDGNLADANWRRIERLKHLELLRLHMAHPPGDDELAQLAARLRRNRAPSLHLHLDTTRVTAKGLQTLKSVPQLHSLWLSHPVSEDSIPVLQSMPQLTELLLFEAGSSDARLRRLRSALPAAQIVR